MLQEQVDQRTGKHEVGGGRRQHQERGHPQPVAEALSAVGVPDAIAAKVRNTAITTRLFNTGTNCGIPKRPCAFKSPPAIAANPYSATVGASRRRKVVASSRSWAASGPVARSVS